MGKIRVTWIWEGLGKLKKSTGISWSNHITGGETEARQGHSNCVAEPSCESGQ